MSSLSPEVGKFKTFEDYRGSMQILYEGHDFDLKIIKMTTSIKGVLRGFHYQSFPLLQRKKIYVLEGEIQDVCMEINDNCVPTGKYFETRLVAGGDNDQLTIPSNWAHAYLTLSNVSKVLYLCDQRYGKEISFNPVGYFRGWEITNENLIISEKDLR